MTSWTDSNRKLSGKLEIRWDGVNWTDESSRLISASGSQIMTAVWQSFGGNVVTPAWTMTCRLRNESDRYSPFNSGSAIYSYIQNNRGWGIACRFSIGLWNGSSFDYTRVFTGYIDRLTISSTRDDRATLIALDNNLPLLQHKHSSTTSADQFPDDWINTLATAGNVAATDLDNGLRQIPYCWLDDENIWTEMNQAATADGGRIYFDRNGTLTFKNAESWIVDTVHNTSQHSFSISRIRDLALPFDHGNIYNEIVVVYAPRVALATETIYQSPRAFSLLPSESKTIVARHRYPATTINTPGADDYTIIDAAGTDMSSSVNISLTAYAQRSEITFTNNHTTKAAVISSFRLTGTPLYGSEAGEVKYQATDSHIGDPTSGVAKTLAISGNAYIQTGAQADMLAAMLRDRLKFGRQVYRLEAPATPTLEPGYRVAITEAGSGVSDDGFIQRIDWTYGGGVYKAHYEIIEVGTWFLYAGYFEIGVDTLNATTSERVYY